MDEWEEALMQRCSICRHVARHEIEDRVLSGEISMRQAASVYEVHRTQLRRHLDNHVGYGSDARTVPSKVQEWVPPRPEVLPWAPTIDVVETVAIVL